MTAPAEPPEGRRPRRGFPEFSRRLLELGRKDRLSWIVCARVDSTSSLARRYLDRARDRKVDRPPPCCFVAWEQTAGRGRHGRTWESAAGLGLYLTLALPDVPPTLLPVLSLMTGCAVASVVSPILPTPVRIKWPNDLLSSRRKLAGVLIETVSRGQERSSTLIGIGLNACHDAGDLPTAGATSLHLEGADPIDLADLAHAISSEMARRLEELPSATEVVEEVRGLTAHREGDRMRCRRGGETVEGSFVGFGADGALILEREGRTETIRSSEILDE